MTETGHILTTGFRDDGTMTLVIGRCVLFPGAHFSDEVIFVDVFYEHSPFPGVLEGACILDRNFNVAGPAKATMSHGLV